MRCMLIGHNFAYEAQTISQIFYPLENFEHVTGTIPLNGLVLQSVIEGDVCRATLFVDGTALCTETAHMTGSDGAAQRLAVKRTVYGVFVAYTGFKPPWGSFTGIRPSKMVHDQWAQGFSDEEVMRFLHESHDIAADKRTLCIEVAKAERALLARAESDADKDCGCRERFGLYIGIPFCPSRCAYCSFTSHPLAVYRHKVDNYVDCLLKEIAEAAVFGNRRRLESVYIGGGTPTALNAALLDKLLYGLKNAFNMAEAIEFTVEAGRPDTITREKLAALKRHGVSRLSINPQTLSPATLVAIGRNHTVAQFNEAFILAREMGFDNINVDIIVGLPHETTTDILRTVRGIADFAPENVTVHTLAVKRASLLKEAGAAIGETSEMAAMMDAAQGAVRAMGLRPYSMYRQKNMVGHGENVGYSKKGYEGLYNVRIMSDRQTILALGAGAVTKTYDEATNRLTRIFNVKDVDEYIGRIDEMLARKVCCYDSSC